MGFDDDLVVPKHQEKVSVRGPCLTASIPCIDASASKEERMEIRHRKYEQCLWTHSAKGVTTDTSSSSSSVVPSVPAPLTSISTTVVDSHTSLLDDLFKDFDDAPVPKHQETASVMGTCLIASVPCIDVAREFGGHQDESMLSDELFPGLHLVFKDLASTDVSTNASEDEGSFESISHRARIDEGIWASFGDW